MKINNRIGVELVSGATVGRCFVRHTLKVWALNRALTDSAVFGLCDLAGFWGSKRVVRRWTEKPEDNAYNTFNCCEVVNEEDSSD
jgi:hypothetical protein